MSQTIINMVQIKGGVNYWLKDRRGVLEWVRCWMIDDRIFPAFFLKRHITAFQGPNLDQGHWTRGRVFGLLAASFLPLKPSPPHHHIYWPKQNKTKRKHTLCLSVFLFHSRARSSAGTIDFDWWNQAEGRVKNPPFYTMSLIWSEALQFYKGRWDKRKMCLLLKQCLFQFTFDSLCVSCLCYL